MLLKIKSIFQHLRFPFSVFLLPVFLFALSDTTVTEWQPIFLIFITLHLIIYPSSNGYNSLMDNDEGYSIGGLKSPPKVPKEMLLVTLVLDSIGLLLFYTYFQNIVALLLLFLYIIASRLYSNRTVRLKKYPIIGFLTVAIVQGAVVYILVSFSLNNTLVFNWALALKLGISFLLVGAGYPLTQVYQHEQDAKDGVKTISMLLGIKNTFKFSNILFMLLGVLMAIYFIFVKNEIYQLLIFLACLLPVLLFFLKWKTKVFITETEANFENTMKMNIIGSVCVNIFFIIIIILNQIYH